MWFYGIYLIIKRQLFNPYINWTWPSAGQLDGRPLQKSVDRSCRPTCTNVHDSVGWWVGRPPESSALWNWPRSTGREHLLSVSSPGRPGGWPEVIKMTVGRSTGRSTGRSFLTFPAANGQIFWRVINGPLLSWFYQEFQEQKFPSF